MPMWRCPHCGTPQAETARCWVCRRSSTACGTCRNFRRSVAGSLGYCGLDRRREPLAGDEIRACWEAWPAAADPTLVAPPSIRPAAGTTTAPARTPRREFVEVGDRPLGGLPDATEPSADVDGASSSFGVGPFPPAPAGEPGWNLWGDAEA